MPAGARRQQTASNKNVDAVSISSPIRQHDLANVSIRIADRGDDSSNLRHNFYTSPAHSPLPRRVPSPLHSAHSAYDSLVKSPYESVTKSPSTPLTPYTPGIHSLNSATGPNSPSSPQSPASPHRKKGSRGDKEFDSIKAAASKHALLEKSREEASRARSNTLRLQNKTMSPATGAQVSVNDGIPSPRLPTMSSAPISLKPDMGAQRTTSSDSTMSLSTSPSQPFPPLEDPSAVDIPALIAAAGSPEAAIRKLLQEKHLAAQNNAQLWRLLNKQRTVMADLNKDIQKAVKDRDRYRKKLKDQLAASASLSILPPGRTSLVDNEDNQSPLISEPASAATSDPPGRKQSPTDDVFPLENENHDEGTSAILAPSQGGQLPGPMHVTPMAAPFASAEDRRLPLRGTDYAAARQPGGPEHRIPTGTPASVMPKSSAISQTDQTTTAPSLSIKTALTSSPRPPTSEAMQGLSAGSRDSASAATRKAPPAPLDLSPPKSAPTTNRSSSDYEKDESDSEQRGRPQKREADQETRKMAVAELQRSMSKRRGEAEKLDRTPKPPPLERDFSTGNLSVVSSSGYSSPEEPGSPHVAQVQTYQSLNALNAVVKTPQTAEYTADARGSQPQHSISTPGLPPSPRPPLFTSQSHPGPIKNSLPLSPRDGAPSITPRAPPQAIPIPEQQTSDNITTTLLSPLPELDGHLAPPATAPPPGITRTPGDIYKGFMTDQWPGLLLPPNALPLIHVKVDSSRLRPSRYSYMAPKQSEENPVFSLAIYASADSSQLWRVEKTMAALGQFDAQIKALTTFKLKLPDRALFTGHAPARIDARRSALGAYFEYLLDTPMSEQAASAVCAFLSSDAIGAESQEYFQRSHIPSGSVDSNGRIKMRPRKDGYLTKKGKNFGGWKARYFVLDGPTLKYFEAPGGAMLGAIKLQYASIGRQTSHAQEEVEEENQFRHAFLVLEPKRKDKLSHVKHVLCAESDEERDHWVQCLMQYVEADEIVRPKTGKSSLDKPSSPISPRPAKSMNDIKRPQDPPTPTGGPGLRAVIYDATIAADAPVMGAKPGSPSPPGSQVGSQVSEPTEEKPPGPQPVISGPTNGAKIQDAGVWGNKREPNVLRKKEDEKPPERDKDKEKERKRSIFAFKGRPSTESNSRDSSMPTISSEHALNRAVFGVPLAEVVEFAGPVDVSVRLPAVVYRSIEYLKAREAVTEQGIFRMSGSNVVIRALKERFDTEGDVNLLAPGEKEYDIHAVASLLKLYLRELPTSILTRDLHLDFIKCIDLDGKTKIEAFNVLVNRLPPPNRELLDKLTGFLREIVDNEKVNKMGVRNVGIVFAPTLNIPAPLISLFVTDHGKIFGPPVDIRTVQDRLPQLLSSSSLTDQAGPPSVEPKVVKRNLFPEISASGGMTAQQIKEQYDIGYTPPPQQNAMRPPPPPAHAVAMERKFSSNSQQSQSATHPASIRQVSSESRRSDVNLPEDYPASAQPHHSFHSMHFPDPPISARPAMPTGPIPSQFQNGIRPTQTQGSPLSQQTLSTNSSTSTLTNGFPSGFQRDSHASVSQPIVPANRDPQSHWSRDNGSSLYSRDAGGDGTRANSTASSTGTVFASRNESVSSDPSANASAAASWRYKKMSLPRLDDIEISSSPLMGGTSPEFNRSSTFAPLSAGGVLHPQQQQQQSTPWSAGGRPMTAGAGGDAKMQGSASQPVGIGGPAYGSLPSGGPQPVMKGSSGGPGTPTQEGFGRRLLRRQSGNFLVRAGLLDEKKTVVGGGGGNGNSNRGFVAGDSGGVGSPRTGNFGR